MFTQMDAETGDYSQGWDEPDMGAYLRPEESDFRAPTTGEVHAQWHAINGTDALCPLDCGIGEAEAEAEYHAREEAADTLATWSRLILNEGIGAVRVVSGTHGRHYALNARGAVVATLQGVAA